MKSDQIIPTLDFSMILNRINDKVKQYPQGSISPREIVYQFDVNQYDVEEALKIADELNSEVSKTILTFQDKLAKRKK
jgi:hypothetical protein